MSIYTNIKAVTLSLNIWKKIIKAVVLKKSIFYDAR